MTTIFISYRRSDSAFEAWHLRESLAAVFGRANVFLDVADIEKGDDFRRAMLEQVEAARLVLVVIGDRWMNVLGNDGRRRLDNPDDAVRCEIETALARGTPILPVYLHPMTGLLLSDLPASLRALEGKNARVLRPGTDYALDIKRLIDDVKLRVPADGGSAPSRAPLKEDLKVVLTDHGVSSRIFHKQAPRLFDCFLASRTLHVPVDEKEDAKVAAFAFNHFIGLGAVVSLNWPGRGERVLLVHSRVSKPGEPANILRKGRSLLFHASYEFNETRTKSRLDHWMQKAEEDRESARLEFLECPGGVLCELLQYKLQLPNLRGICRPFGVVTSNLRKAENRIYTQYVFTVELQFESAPTLEDLERFVAAVRTQHDNRVSVLPTAETPNSFLEEASGPKVMDYLVLAAMGSDDPITEHEHGHFTRGFELL